MPRPMMKVRPRMTEKGAPSWENSSIASVAAMRTGKPMRIGAFLLVLAMIGLKSSMPINCEIRMTPIR